MGTIYPRSDHYPPNPEISSSKYPPNGKCQVSMNGTNSFFQKVPETPFSAKYLPTRGPKMRPRTRECMYRGQGTHLIRVNARYEMSWANNFFQKVPETPFLVKNLATRGPKMRLGTRKCHVIIVIETDLWGVIVIMHSGYRPRDFTSCFARSLLHCDNKPLQNHDFFVSCSTVHIQTCSITSQTQTAK